MGKDTLDQTKELATKGKEELSKQFSSTSTKFIDKTVDSVKEMGN